MKIHPIGDEAVLLDELDVTPANLAMVIRDAANAGRIQAAIDVVPAACTVLVTGPAARDHAALTQLVDAAASSNRDAPSEVLRIAVRYAGPDLAAVAAACGLTVDEVIAVHSGATYTVAFTGFAPGFGYLTGLPTVLQLPRRRDPRPMVPAGSVAIASQYSAIYPRATPGGWHLLGVADIVLFDPAANPPTPLVPGTSVWFDPQ